MKLLATWNIRHFSQDRTIELLSGDLAQIPPEHAVDVLVVSAFPNDYLRTPGSLIGALGAAGLSVEELATHKQIDMRQQFSCWLSEAVEPIFNFRRVLCIESGWRGTPLQNTDDLFRALAPLLLTDLPNSSVAMPIIGAGDQGWPAMEMLESILRAAIAWIERGLKLRQLKIVIRNESIARDAVNLFASLERQYRASASASSSERVDSVGAAQHDVFISYSRAQISIARFLVSTLKASPKPPAIFVDLTDIPSGASWPTKVAMALDASRRVVTLLSPSFWASGPCQLEFSAALARQLDTNESILFPLLLEDVQIPYLYRTLQHIDCRINDRGRLTDACKQLAASLA